MLDQLIAPFEFFSSDTLILLPILIGLEAVLSADNAIALAAIARGLEDEKLQRDALNVGLIVAFILRVLLILTATWVTRFWQFELAGAAYLLWLSVQYFAAKRGQDDAEAEAGGYRFTTLWQAIPLIAVTDLAFSLDSVTTALALSKETWLVITGGAIGVLALRFMAELFIRWLKEYEYLEDAGYVAVALVGLRLLVRVVNDGWVPPEWVMVSLIVLVFAWGFSKRTALHQADEAAGPTEASGSGLDHAEASQEVESEAIAPGPVASNAVDSATSAGQKS